jgi:L-cysteine/cystine lyase
VLDQSALEIERVRSLLPVTAVTAYLNTGTAGPWSTPVVEAIERALRREHGLGRASPGGLPDFRPVLRETRARLADWIGADPDEVALTGSTTEGVDIGVWGLDWLPNDEIVTTSIEHRGVLAPARQVAQRRSVTLRIAQVGQGEAAAALRAIRAEIGPRTRLIAVSHVSFSTGACLPVEAIAEMAHAAGALLIVDGAQALGAVPVDVHRLGVDVYAFSGQKWLFGPEGTGGLYVRREVQAQLAATYVAARSGGEGASRYEYGTLFRPGVHGLHAALGWLDGVGRQTVFGRIGELTAYCATRLADLPGVSVLTPAGQRAGLVNVQLPGVDLDACVAFLDQRGFTLRSVADTSSLRISCAFFNTPDEIDRLVDAISRFREAARR